jgi:hypothetical protein
MSVVAQNLDISNPDPKWIDLIPNLESQTIQTGIDVQFMNRAVSWAVGQDYRVGDIVAVRNPTPQKNADSIFQCTTSHTSSTVKDYGPPGIGKFWKPIKGQLDRYLHAGLIMFDSKGELIGVRYAIKAESNLGKAAGVAGDTEGGYSQFGIAVYDDELFQSQGFTPIDAQLSNGSIPYKTGFSNDEEKEEKWLDENALPFLVNRYSGALIRGQ